MNSTATETHRSALAELNDHVNSWRPADNGEWHFQSIVSGRPHTLTSTDAEWRTTLRHLAKCERAARRAMLKAEAVA